MHFILSFKITYLNKYIRMVSMTETWNMYWQD